MKKLIIILFLFLFLVGCKTPEEPKATEPAKSEPTAPEGPIVTETDIPTKPSEPTGPAVTTTTKEALSQVKCVGSKIEGIVTNTANEPVDILKEASAIIHGVLVINPSLMECEKTTLEPGESTYCGSLAGKYQIAEKNRFIFRMTGVEEGIIKIVECPKS